MCLRNPSRHRTIGRLLAVAATLLVSACSVQNDEPAPLKIAFLPKMKSNEFWDVLHAGVQNGVQNLRNNGVAIEVIWDGPDNEEALDDQIRMLYRFANQQVNAIVLSPQDRIQMIEPVQEVQRQGIPIITFDSTLNMSDIACHVGTDNYQAGVDAADYLGKLLHGRGRILMQRYMNGSASSMEREAGFANRIRENWPNLEILPWNTYSGAIRSSALQVCREGLQQHGQQADAIFVSTQFVGNEMLRACSEFRFAKEIPLVIFDTNPMLVNALSDGRVQALVVQSELRMGEDAVLYAYKRIRGESIPEQVNTPIHIIDRSNMNDPELAKILQPQAR